MCYGKLLIKSFLVVTFWLGMCFLPRKNRINLKKKDPDAAQMFLNAF